MISEHSMHMGDVQKLSYNAHWYLGINLKTYRVAHVIAVPPHSSQSLRAEIKVGVVSLSLIPCSPCLEYLHSL